jgi:hypothetical protein
MPGNKSRSDALVLEDSSAYPLTLPGLLREIEVE